MFNQIHPHHITFLSDAFFSVSNLRNLKYKIEQELTRQFQFEIEILVDEDFFKEAAELVRQLHTNAILEQVNCHFVQTMVHLHQQGIREHQHFQRFAVDQVGSDYLQPPPILTSPTNPEEHLHYGMQDPRQKHHSQFQKATQALRKTEIQPDLFKKFM